ncbi:hypothetical protein FOIG_16856 [Fusarium odoratissimum NRRL 54006]|uniref:Uncharacterized protein n=1 Tax=Fusarium odoratissimum (strain NRRL 54006) TaxID=1089451 RepID=X0J0J2_FUSO5|nr:uncharacterized protein FOIG_16856 [Fusarium odoratissimum NRRL 54006]EXL89861.1 hypothetical protein FOIG_16856 [Fusarium odoratissimum NRRL 54006]
MLRVIHPIALPGRDLSLFYGRASAILICMSKSPESHMSLVRMLYISKNSYCGISGTIKSRRSVLEPPTQAIPTSAGQGSFAPWPIVFFHSSP